MAKNDNRRITIFEKYSKNLHLLSSHGLLPGITLKYEKTYICPLCLGQFDFQTLNNQNVDNPLTLEDVPPVSLGGRANVLTCKKCNNTAGSQVDVHLLNQTMRLKNYKLTPGSNFPVTLSISDQAYFRGTVRVDPDGEMHVFISEKNNNAKKIEEFNNSSLLKSNPIANMHFKPSKEIDMGSLNAGIVKIAYLSFFEKTGYALILDNYYNPLREQILKPQYKIFTSNFNSSHEGKAINLRFGTYFGGASGRKFIFIFFPLTIEKYSVSIISIIPLPFLRIDVETNAIFELATNAIREGIILQPISDTFLNDSAVIGNLQTYITNWRLYYLHRV